MSKILALTTGPKGRTTEPSKNLNMLQLLADVVTPACEELEAIMQEIDTQAASPTLSQGRKARVKKKGR